MKLRTELLLSLVLASLVISAFCEITTANRPKKRVLQPWQQASVTPSPGVPVPSVPSTGVSPLLGPPLLSTVEFFVDAETKSGDYLKATNTGGAIFLKGRLLKVVPWNIIYDAKTGTWVVFLANVTSDNFSVMYLYLRNGTGYFTVWHYEYESSLLDGYIFYGADYVKNKTSSTPTPKIQRLSIMPQTKNPSGISALGPTVFINSQGGLYLNQTRTLYLYSLLYRSFSGTNELWLLIGDHQGRYYYSIFYLFDSDRDHVLRGHTLCLNDYSLAAFESIAAQWMPGLFPYALNVVSDQSNITTKINGFPFRTDQLGRIELRVPGGDIQIEAQKEALTGTGSRRVFSEWKWLTKSNPALVRISQNTDLYPQYKTQFYLSVKSPYGSPVGEGWYDEGTTAKFSVDPAIDLMNGTRFVFSRWTDGQNDTAHMSTVTLDRPKTVSAIWKRQYEIRISARGVPQGTSLNLTVNSNQTTVIAPFTSRQWVDADSAVKMAIDPVRFSSSNRRFMFVQWQRESGSAIGVPIVVNGPLQIVARYDMEEPFAGRVTIQADPTVLLLKETITIRGTTNPAQPRTEVVLLWSRDSVEWNVAATVVTDSQGSYEHVWKAESVDKIYLKARWTYDSDYEPIESSVVTVTLIGSSANRIFQWPQLLRNLVGFLENFPFFAQFLAMTLSFITRIYEVVVWTTSNVLFLPIYLGSLVLLVFLIWRRATRRPSSSH